MKSLREIFEGVNIFEGAIDLNSLINDYDNFEQNVNAFIKDLRKKGCSEVHPDELDETKPALILEKFGKKNITPIRLIFLKPVDNGKWHGYNIAKFTNDAAIFNRWGQPKTLFGKIICGFDKDLILNVFDKNRLKPARGKYFYQLPEEYSYIFDTILNNVN